MATPEKGPRSVAEIMAARENELLETWMENVVRATGNRALELTSEEQLRRQTTELLRTLTVAFGSEDCEDITRPEFADSVAMLRNISSARAKQGLSPTETATYVLSLKDALLKHLQENFGDDPVRLNVEVIRMNKVIDKLALVTFEAFVATREEIVAQQSRSLLELSHRLSNCGKGS